MKKLHDEGTQALFLTRNGVTDYTIVVGNDAIEPVRHAARELAAFLKTVTGATFPIEPESGRVKAPRIFVGNSAALRKAAPGLSLDGLGEEGIVIATRGRELVLVGGRPRGTLYAVYTFLEDYVGCRWYSPSVSRIPSRPDLSIAPVNHRRVPVLEYRDPFAFVGFDADWAARNKSTGFRTRLDERRGGKTCYAGFVHTLGRDYVSPDEYFDAHPEYFPEIDGRRVRKDERNQLCLTNPDVVHIVTDEVREVIRNTPGATIASVSQHDSFGDSRCQCAKCLAVEEEEGSPSGPLLRFVNQVAERIEKDYPRIAIDTLAYRYTRKPPKHVKPRDNVIVRLCTIETSFAHPLGTSEENAPFCEDIAAWSKICKRLYVWDYVTNFRPYMMPHPNLRVLQPNIQFFLRHNVKGIFAQGNYESPGGEFEELRTWLLAKLLWNPEVNFNALMDDFLNACYGSAAPVIKQYIDLIHDAVEEADCQLTCDAAPDPSFLSPEVIVKADALFTEAEEAVAEDADLLHRVQVARLPVYYVMMEEGERLDMKTPDRNGSWVPSLCGKELVKRFFAIADAEGVTHIGEHDKRHIRHFRAKWLHQPPE